MSGIETNNVVERLRSWPAITQGDALSASTVALLMEDAADLIQSLSDRNERLNEWLADIQMNAHKWMEAHDRLKAGKPYDLPKPADLPDTVQSLSDRIDVLEGERERFLEVEKAARELPRATPGPGSCSTEHRFAIEAGVVWTNDIALKRLDKYRASLTQGGKTDG